MAVMRILRVCTLLSLLCYSEAMFKRDVRSVMEEEFPNMTSIGDAVSKATSKAKSIVHRAEEAAEDFKEMALSTFEAAAAKVNESLKMVGQQVRDMNSTAMKAINDLDDKVKVAKNKAAVFASGTSEALEKVEPIFEQFQEKLRSVTKMATDVLASLHQEKALSSLDKAMDTVYATASSWKLAMQDLDQQLQQMNETMSNQAAFVEVAATRANRSNFTKAPPPALIQSSPVEEASKTLKAPMRKLESAAYQLDSLVGEAVGAMGKFVDGALEAAAGTVPLPLMAEVKEVLKGVEDEAMTQLSPLGEVGKDMVDGLYKAGKDAGLNFGSYGVRGCRLPLALLLGLVAVAGGHF